MVDNVNASANAIVNNINSMVSQQDILSMNPTQKVAALLILLGPTTASEVLKNIKDNDLLEQIALEIASLNKVPMNALAVILEEFRSLFQASSYLAKGGKDYAKQVLELTYGPEQAKRIMMRLETLLNANPFQLFNEADPIQLATSFQNENPQLIALILAYLQPAQSAKILNCLPPDVQAQVAMKIAEMDTTNPEILADIEKIVESKFSSVMVQDFSQAGGIDTLANILNRTDRATERNVLDLLEIENPELADEVRELMFVFEDIVRLDNKTVQRILREVNTKDLALALKGTKQEVRDKIFVNMSERAQQMLRDDMEYLGPVRARDVQETQTQICAIIKSLEASGEIVIEQNADEDEFID
ncbi:MAG: flagellar motor switch protein FliG [Candidatus Gastranaerophilaceae bacterium]